MAVHILCAILLFHIVWLTFENISAEGSWRRQAPAIGLAAALVWSLHPIQVGTVTYLSARSESLMGLFYLLTLYAGIRAVQSPTGVLWATLSVTACALGMACKQSMVTAPVVMVFYDRAFVFDSFGQAVQKRWRFYVALAATWIVLAILLWPAPRELSAGFGVGVSVWTYLLNQAVVRTDYLRVALVPRRLIFAYGEPRPISLLEAAPYAALVCTLAGLTVWAWLARPALGFAGVWFFVTLAPTSSVVPIATEVGAERRMYLPLAGVATLVVVLCCMLVVRYAVRRSRPRRAVALNGPLIAGLAAVALAFLTVQRNVVYASPETLWRTALDNWPSTLAHRNLATALSLAGKRDEALVHLRETVSEHPEVRYIIGVTLFELQRFDECIAELGRYLDDNPHSDVDVDAREILGRACAAKGVPARAAGTFAGILKTQPGHAVAQIGLADALFAQGANVDAVPLYEEYLKTHPNHVGALTNLGIALRGNDDVAAVRALERAVEAAPGSEAAHRNLAAVLLSRRDLEGAALHAGRSVALKPDAPVGRELYGQVLVSKGQYPQAIEQFERVLALDPSNNEVRQELARIRRFVRR